MNHEEYYQNSLKEKLEQAMALKSKLDKLGLTMADYRYHYGSIKKAKDAITDFIDKSVNLSTKTSGPIVVEEYRHMPEKGGMFTNIKSKDKIEKDFSAKLALVNQFLKDEGLSEHFSAKHQVTDSTPFTIKLQLEFNE